jgi:dihydroorotate dehydrogenase
VDQLLYRKLLKPILFRMDAEKAHHLLMGTLSGCVRIPGMQMLLHALFARKTEQALRVERFGLSFAHPLGLAAGLDKNAEAVPAFSAIGFAFMEVGTLTPKSQPGNDLPRLFRLPVDQALINRMGFNNVGAVQAATTLRDSLPRSQYRIPIAVNIGKNKTTANEQAVEDYRACVRELFEYGDFFVVNISSPNTPDLRNLQYGEELSRLLQEIIQEMVEQASSRKVDVKPILVKIAPDMSERELKEVVATIVQSGVAGIIATNTTVSRDGLQHPHQKEMGGLSGLPVRHRSTEFIRLIYKWTNGKLPIIGSGGIFDADDAYEKIRAGASLVEVYTGLVYRGPEMIGEIQRGLLKRMHADGFGDMEQAIGADHREGVATGDV